MSRDNNVGEYTRQDLREYEKFVEGDFRGINPRRFYRELKREIEEIQHGEGFKYVTQGDQKSNLKISSEQVGEKTGTIEGRMKANSDWVSVGSAYETYRPYGHLAVLAGILGLLFAVAGFSDAIWFVPALGLLGAGYYGYSQEEEDEYDVIRQNEIRVLMSGEVSERKVTEDGKSRTDMFADMSVIFAAESMTAIDATSVNEKHKQFRSELVRKVRELFNSVVPDPADEVPVDTGLTAHFNRLSSKSEKKHKKEIENVQSRALSSTLEIRRAYGDAVKETLPSDVQEELNEQEEMLLVELQDLADNLDIYVEREGLEHKNNLSERTSPNRKLESDSKQ